MKKLMILMFLNFLFLSCKSDEIKNVKQYNIRNNTICCDRSYGVLIREEKERIYFLGEGPILVGGADFKTFKAYDGFKEKDDIRYDAEDINSYYYQGQIVKKK